MNPHSTDPASPSPSSMGLVPVGYVRSTRKDPTDDDWDAESSTIEMLPRFGAESLLGLDSFSHCIVIYRFHRADPEPAVLARHPRGNPDWPLVGIFAQRAKDRPNALGVTTCKINAVRGAVLSVEGLDAIDGTPVIDIKPYMAEFGPRGAVHQPRWVDELMEDYWSVAVTE